MLDSTKPFEYFSQQVTFSVYMKITANEVIFTHTITYEEIDKIKLTRIQQLTPVYVKEDPTTLAQNTAQGSIDIRTRDFHEVHVKCDAGQIGRAYTQLTTAILAATQAQQSLKSKGLIYAAKDEFARMGCKSTQFQIINYNGQDLIVTKGMNPEIVARTSELRGGEGVPSLAWGTWDKTHPLSGAFILVASRPLVFQESKSDAKDKEGSRGQLYLPANRASLITSSVGVPVPIVLPPQYVPSRAEYVNEFKVFEEIVRIINEQTPEVQIASLTERKKLIVFDSGNMPKDALNDFEYPHLSYAYFHFSQSSLDLAYWTLFNIAISRCYQPGQSVNEPFFNIYYGTNWSGELLKIMSFCSKVISSLVDGSPVMLQKSNSDCYLINIVSCLVQICVDPHYRTFSGLWKLLSKDFFSLCFQTKEKAQSETSSDKELNGSKEGKGSRDNIANNKDTASTTLNKSDQAPFNIETFTGYAWNNNVAEFKQALKVIFPGDINNLNSRGQSALYCAAHRGNLDILVELLNFPGLDVNTVAGGHGGTALHAAGFNEHDGAVALLLAAGADSGQVNTRGISGRQDAVGKAIDAYELFGKESHVFQESYPLVKKLVLKKPVEEKQDHPAASKKRSFSSEHASFTMLMHCIVEIIRRHHYAFEYNEYYLEVVTDHILSSELFTPSFNKANLNTFLMNLSQSSLTANHIRNATFQPKQVTVINLSAFPVFHFESVCWFPFFLRHNRVINTLLDSHTTKLLEAKGTESADFSGTQSLWLPPLSDATSTLNTLVIDNCGITSIPYQFDFKCIKTLSLNKNKIYDIPPVIFTLLSLETLLMEQNFIKTIPKEIAHLTRLINVSFKQNPLEYVAPVCNLPQLKFLSVQRALDKKKLVFHFPFTSAASFQSLEDVNMEGYNFPCLDQYFFEHTKNLKTANFSYNKLKYLNEFNCPALTSLFLKNNCLLDLPLSLQHSVLLKELNISSNKTLTILPRAIGFLINLEILFAEGCSIVEMPFWLADLQQLRHLDLSGNDVAVIAASLSECKRLQYLNLSNNKITSLPFFLSSLSKLVKLDVRDNNITWPLPREELTALMTRDKGGTKDILKALKEKLDGEEMLLRSNIVLYGHDKAGKKAFLQTFTQSKLWKKTGSRDVKALVLMEQYEVLVLPQLEEINAKTGLTPTNPKKRDTMLFKNSEFLQKFTFEKKQREEKVMVSLSRFSDEKFSKSAHQFFMAAKAWHFVTASLMEPNYDDKLEYWLRILKTNLKGRTQKVVVLLTHADEYLKSIGTKDLTEFQTSQTAKFYSITKKFAHCSFHCINCLDKESVSTFRHYFQAELGKDPDVFGPVKLKSMQFESIVNTNALGAVDPDGKFIVPIYDRTGLLSIASSVNLKKLVDIKLTANYFHALGTLIFVEDGKILKDIVIRDPGWLVVLLDLILKVKTTDSLKTSENSPEQYTITHEQLMNLLENEKYPRKSFNMIVGILEEFEMICATGNDVISKNTCYVIPHLLEKERPKQITNYWFKELAEEHEMNRIYQIEHIPPVFFSRLISRILSYCNKSAKFLWASGIVVDIGDGDDIVSVYVALTTSLDGDPADADLAANKTKFPMVDGASKKKDTSSKISIHVRGKNVTTTRNLFATMNRAVDMVIAEFSHLASKCFWYYGQNLKGDDLIPLTDIEQTLKRTLDTHFESKYGRILYADIIPEKYIHTYEGLRVSDESLQLGRVLGEGGYATVYESKHNDRAVAVKKMKQKPDALRDFQQEVFIQGNLQHPNIVRIIAICLFPNSIVQEYCTIGNLYDYIQDWDTAIPWKVRISITIDMANGIKYLQDRKPYPIAHLDLKSPNVLLIADEGPVKIQAKISDFGTSQEVVKPITIRKVDNPTWCAPEVIKGLPYDQRADVYSFGVICWELLTREKYYGEISWQSVQEAAIISGARPPCGSFPPYEYKTNIIEKCWKDDPLQRPQMAYCIGELQKLIPKSAQYDQTHGDVQFKAHAEIKQKRVQDELKKKAMREEEEREAKARAEAAEKELAEFHSSSTAPTSASGAKTDGKEASAKPSLLALTAKESTRSKQEKEREKEKDGDERDLESSRREKGDREKDDRANSDPSASADGAPREKKSRKNQSHRLTFGKTKKSESSNSVDVPKRDSPKPKEGSGVPLVDKLRVPSLAGQTKKDAQDKDRSAQDEKGEGERGDERDGEPAEKTKEERKEKEKDDGIKFGALPSAFSIPSLASFLPTTKRSESMKDTKDKERAELHRVSSDKMDSARKHSDRSDRDKQLSRSNTQGSETPSSDAKPSPPNSTGLAIGANASSTASGGTKRDATPPNSLTREPTNPTSIKEKEPINPASIKEKEPINPNAAKQTATQTSTKPASLSTTNSAQSSPTANQANAAPTTATGLKASNPVSNGSAPTSNTNTNTNTNSNAGARPKSDGQGRSVTGKSLEEEEIITLLPPPHRKQQTRSLSVHVTTSKVSHNTTNSHNPHSAVSNAVNSINATSAFTSSDPSDNKKEKACCSLSRTQGHNFCRGCGVKLSDLPTPSSSPLTSTSNRPSFHKSHSGGNLNASLARTFGQPAHTSPAKEAISTINSLNSRPSSPTSSSGESGTRSPAYGSLPRQSNSVRVSGPDIICARCQYKNSPKKYCSNCGNVLK